MTKSRRDFLKSSAAVTFGGLALSTVAGTPSVVAQNPNVVGFDDTKTVIDESKTWQQKFDRKIRMGLVGYGVCKFGTAFGLQNHPNVELIAVSDLFPDRCDAMAKAAKCEKTYPSLEEMVKDDSIEAIFCGTDAPSHARHCLEVMKHGKHVATAVPATFTLEEADMLDEMVKKTGLNYMMFETSVYHDRLYAMRQIYNAGGFGKLIYSEGEYYGGYSSVQLDSYKGWRIGIPPQYYPTHSNAYYSGVTSGSFTEVSCMGFRDSVLPQFRPENNAYKNPFCTEVAFFRTSEGGMARMAVTWGTPGIGGETGRVSGQKGSFWGNSFGGLAEANELVSKLNLKKPPLPPTVDPGGHGGSHGYLGHEFVMSILENRKPLVDIAMSLNMTVSGIIAHQSALKDGELMKIPQYTF